MQIVNNPQIVIERYKDSFIVIIDIGENASLGYLRLDLTMPINACLFTIVFTLPIFICSVFAIAAVVAFRCGLPLYRRNGRAGKTIHSTIGRNVRHVLAELRYRGSMGRK